MKKICAALVLSFLTSACSTIMPSNISNTVDVSKVDFSAAYDFKTGSDCAYYLAGFIPVTSGAYFLDAVKDANLTKVNFVESGYEYYLLFGRYCIRAYGE